VKSSGVAPGGRVHLTVVIPAYREQATIADTIADVARHFNGRGVAHEILVVDDGSPDRTGETATRALTGARGKVLRHRENRGKGAAVRTGVLAASGRWVLITDADLSTPIEEHESLARVCRERDLDGAIGSRALDPSRLEQPQRWLRRTMGKTFNRIVRAFTGLPFRDTQCGFKLFDRKRVMPLFEQAIVDRFAWDVEILFLAARLGIRVAEVPVTWRNVEDSRVGLLGDPIQMLRDVARVWWRFRRGGYRGAESGPAGKPTG
jgi:glycosyltransferase involved in cell wall biosynthesis